MFAPSLARRLFGQRRASALLCLFTSLLLVACSADTAGTGPDRGGDGERGEGRDVSTSEDAEASDTSSATDAEEDAGDDVTPEDTGAATDTEADVDAEQDTGADVQADVTDDTTPDVQADVPRPDVQVDVEDCAEVTFAADSATKPADIIWVIDGSESMSDEIDIVQTRINDFAERVAESGIDIRVMMVASKEDRTVTITIPLFPVPVPQSYLGVCVPPPLSAEPGCPDTDNPPLFTHVDVDVYSTDALERLFEDAYDTFRPNLRSWARTHVVVVSDDSSGKDADWFTEQLGRIRGPGFSTDLAFHAIVDVNYSGEDSSCGQGSPGTYIALADRYPGVISSICQPDWTPIFDALFEEVAAEIELPCAYEIPPPPDDAEINPDRVNVYITPGGGEAEVLPNVPTRFDCGEDGGWYYDDPRDPAVVFLCPNVCGDGVDASIDIAFGCDTVKL